MPNYLHREEIPPFKHQEDFFYFAWDKPYAALFSGIGVGKSRMLIDLAANRFAQGQIESCLVIAPSGVQIQWAREEIPAFCAVPFETLVFEVGLQNSKAKERVFEEFCKPSKEGKLKWLLTNIEVFSRDTYLQYFRCFLKATQCFTILDESHYAKSLDAKRTQNVLYGLSDVTMYGNRMVASKPLSKYRAIATGTMVTNSPYDLYSMMSFLKPDYFGVSFSSFKSRYGIERTDRIPGTMRQFRRKLSLKEMKEIRAAKARGMKDEVICRIFMLSPNDLKYLVEHPDVQMPFKHLDELKQSLKPAAFIVKKEDCLDLPPQIYEKRYVEMNDDQKKVYKEMCAKLESEYKGVELTALNSLSLLIRLSQITSGFYPVQTVLEQVDEWSGKSKVKTTVAPLALGQSNPKIDALVEMLEVEETFPCLVLCRFVAEATACQEKLKTVFPDKVIELVMGAVEKQDRAKIIENFKAGDVDILVATSQTVGTGFNLQKASTAYFLSNSYSFEQREQTEGRIHRAGTTADKVVYIDFLCPGTIDERIYQVLRQKRDLLEYMRSVSLTEFLGGGKA